MSEFLKEFVIWVFVLYIVIDLMTKYDAYIAGQSGLIGNMSPGLARERLKCMEMLETLRSRPGWVVVIAGDLPAPDAAFTMIEVKGEWVQHDDLVGGWSVESFRGVNLLDCLAQAVAKQHWSKHE